jgi:hypothetical protein
MTKRAKIDNKRQELARSLKSLLAECNRLYNGPRGEEFYHCHSLFDMKDVIEEYEEDFRTNASKLKAVVLKLDKIAAKETLKESTMDNLTAAEDYLEYGVSESEEESDKEESDKEEENESDIEESESDTEE